MKRLQTAALIAIAFASPVRGETVFIDCFDITPGPSRTPKLEISFDTNDFSGYAGLVGNSLRDLRLLSQSDNHIAWIFEGYYWGDSSDDHLISIYLLDRSSMMLNFSSVSLGQIDYFEDTGDLLQLQRQYRCSRPL